jgi:serine-type D-Ala-D-Ala carboxypeptidase (penicillin-binding protein 5/6)
MLERIRPRAVLAGALLTVLAAAGPSAAASAAGLGGPSSSAGPGTANIPGAPAPTVSSGPTASSGAVARAVGGPQLASHGVVVNYPSGSAPRLPDIQASAFVVADANTGQVLAAKDPHGRYRPASTLKMLTAVALIPLLNPDATVVASKLATSTVPNVVGLVAGRAYQISDLFTALLTISANDAAIALTQATGSFGQGMALINAEARHLQADDTVAVEPNGLDAPGQHTSAYDLALIARQALKMPAFLKYDQTRSARFVVARRKAVELYNQNSLLTTYPGAIGGKIGWTSAAGATYVGMASRNGVTLIVTLLHCPALTEVTSAEKLLNWGFAADGKVAPAGTLVGPLQPPAARATPPPARDQVASGSHKNPVDRPSVLAAAGFSCVAVLAAVFGFAYSRRQRLRASQADRADHFPDRFPERRDRPDRSARNRFLEHLSGNRNLFSRLVSRGRARFSRLSRWICASRWFGGVPVPSDNRQARINRANGAGVTGGAAEDVACSGDRSRGPRGAGRCGRGRWSWSGRRPGGPGPRRGRGCGRGRPRRPGSAGSSRGSGRRWPRSVRPGPS